MNYLISAATVFLAMSSLSANADCLSDGIVVSDITFVSSADDYLTVSYSIMNGLNFPIAGVYIRIKANYPGRPSPIADQPMQGGMHIRGGLLPGETIAFTDYLATGSRAAGFIVDASKLEFSVSIENVADKDMVSYYEGALVGGWSPGPSTFRCD